MKNKREYLAMQAGYRVTPKGQLLSPQGKAIGSVKSHGYEAATVLIEGKRKPFSTHRLQAFQKFGALLYKKGVEVRHRDGNRLNNSEENILIGTHSQNMMDVPKNLRKKRAKHASSFIKKYPKEKVLAFHSVSMSYKKTMAAFGISSKGTLHFILNN